MPSWLSAHSTGMPVIDAQDDFLRARRAALAARAGRWLARRRRRANHPRTLADAAALPTGAARLEVIALASIVGTAESTKHFDACFRPTSGLVRSRWERVALAHRKGVALPPISVLEAHDGYYVVDGRHRVSVARALGRRDIDAWVTRGRSADRSNRSTSAPAQRQGRVRPVHCVAHGAIIYGEDERAAALADGRGGPRLPRGPQPARPDLTARRSGEAGDPIAASAAGSPARSGQSGWRTTMQQLFVHGHVVALNLAQRLRRRLADERGQGTVEYVGLILLVSMLMVGMVVAMRGFNKLRA